MMKVFTTARSVLFFLIATVVAQNAIADNGRLNDFVTFYSSPGYRGASVSVEGAGAISNLRSRRLDFFTGLTGYSTRRRDNWDDAISSIQFNGRFKVTLYKDRSFEGPSVSYTTNRSTLTGGFDNAASSITWEPLFDGETQPRIIFYDQPNYQGASFILYPKEEISRLEKKRRTSRSKDWDDEIRSIRIVGEEVRVTLYADKSYKGRRVTVRSDASNLMPIGFSGVASSLKTYGEGSTSWYND